MALYGWVVGKLIAMKVVASGWWSVFRVCMRAGLGIRSRIRCVPGGLREGFEDPGLLGESGGGDVDWNCWWKDVGAHNEDNLEPRGIQEDMGILCTSGADGGGFSYW